MTNKQKLQSIVDKCGKLQKDLREIELNSMTDRSRGNEWTEKRARLKALLEEGEKLINK